MKIFVVVILVLVSLVSVGYSENIVFPKDAGVVDITRPPYNAKGDGTTDDTLAIQQALSDHYNANKIIYMPNGTYLISDTLVWPHGWRGGLEEKRTILQGQSRDGSILILNDATPGYNDPEHPKSMIWTGEKPAQRFRNSIRNLTIDTGKSNPGAIGCQFMANNQGCMRDVLIRSGDGQGPIGLDMAYTDEEGPCLIERIHVIGFDIGIKTAYAVDSITFEHITVENQNKFGFWNDGQCISMRGLISRNQVPAVYNQGTVGLMTLLDSELTGTGFAEDQPAIINEAAMLARNIQITGYNQSILHAGDNQKTVERGSIQEFITHEVLTLFESSPQKTLNLPIKETPQIPWDDLEQWISPLDFGGNPDDEVDDTDAIQKAIDAGKTTVYLPNGIWVVEGRLILRGSVQRFIGCEAEFEGNGSMEIADGVSGTVVFERFMKGYGSNFKIKINNSRTTILSSCILGHVDSIGSGEVFIDDICGDSFRFSNQKVWARQWNSEPPVTKITNDGGTMWILGLKTEREGTLIHTLNGGKTELLGGFCYATSHEKIEPMFVSVDSDVCYVIGESSFNNWPFMILVRETRGKETKELKKGDAPGRTGGSMIPLFTGYSNSEKEPSLN